MTSCAWCASPLQERRRKDGSGWRRATEAYCSQRCRQAGWRLKRRRDPGNATDVRATGPGLLPGARFDYYDPPYVGLAKRYYGDQPSYAGEVDHDALIASATADLETGATQGWALSCSVRSLRHLLPLCPADVRVGAWVKPIGVSGRTFGPHNTWEAVIVAGGRKMQPGVRDWGEEPVLRGMPARGEGDLIGRKSQAFCAWLFDLLGMVPGDEIVDHFPGTGIVTKTWRNLSVRATQASVLVGRRVVLASLVDGQPEPRASGVPA